MSTAVVKNIGAAALVLGALVAVVLLVGSGPSPTSSSPVAATSSTMVIPPATVDPASAITCPAGTVARADPGPVPAQVAPGFRWSPATYPTSGWCEVPV